MVGKRTLPQKVKNHGEKSYAREMKFGSLQRRLKRRIPRLQRPLESLSTNNWYKSFFLNVLNINAIFFLFPKWHKMITDGTN